MINFIDETGKQHSAIVECKKTKGVNGEKSLTGTIYTNDEILEGIGRGWRLQFENENYCLTYVNPIDEGTRIVVEFDAVHEFFFDMSKSVVYAELNGSNTAGAYLDFIFNDSGYDYHLEVTIPAFEKESFGMKNRLDLFKDFVSSTGVEFSVSGKIVRILEKVGSNLSTIVKKGFNLNELRIEKNIGNFITYLRGYGAYNDPEDQTKGRLEVEYLSPLASIYGKLEGNPIVDERYKNTASLTTRLKNEIESSYGISVDIDMEDLTKAGYEYDQPHEGDYIMAINKDLGFEQKIRIMSYTTSYDTEGNVIDHDVSCGSDNLVSQVTKSDNDFRKNVQAGLENAVNTANQAWISADGKNKVFVGPSEPTASSKGDIWYQVDGEKTIMKFWNGYEWQAFIDPKAVQQAATEAKALGEEAKQAGEEAKALGNEALVAGQNAVNKATTADSNASTALANANNAVDKATQASQKADTSVTTANEAKAQAVSAVTNANAALANANKAVSDVGTLSKDVSELDTIANQAKSDASTALINANKGITDAKTALDKATGVDTRVTTEITNVNNTLATKANSSTVDSLSATVSSQGTAISQNATDIKLKADSTVVNTIKGTVDSHGTLISQNASDIKLKANQTSVNTLTGRVSANEAAIEVTSQGISTLVTKTDSTNTALSQFKQDYDGFKTTVYSKTQTDTKISTVQSTLDNFKTTVSSTYSSKSETDSKVTAVQANVDKLGTNIAYVWSPDGKDRFTRVKPGENIIRNSDFRNGLDNWTGDTSLFSISQESGDNLVAVTVTGQTTAAVRASLYGTTIPVKANDYIVVSGWFRGKDIETKKFFIVEAYDSNGGRVQYADMATDSTALIWSTPVTNNTWSKFYLRWKITDVNAVSAGFRYVPFHNGTYSYKKWKLEADTPDGKATIYTTNPQDDYDNSTPRYIGRSLKDSTNPADFKFEPNPERKPWTAYAQGVNGEGFSLMPYGEQLLPNTGFVNSNSWEGVTSVSDGALVMSKTTTTTSRVMMQTYLTRYDISVLYNAQVEIYIESTNGSLKNSGSSWFLRTIDSSSTVLNSFDYILDELEEKKWIKLERINRDLNSKTDKTKGLYFAVAMGNNFVGTVKIRKPKLELANTMGIPTPWTPAPSEDPLGAIPKYVGTAALPYDDWTKYDWRLSSDWNEVKTSTSIDQTNKAIILKADQTTVNAITGRVSTAEGAITTMAGQIDLKANKTDVNTLTGRVSATESSLSLQDGKITALTTKTDGHTTQIGNLQTSYSGLSSTVAQVQSDLNGKATTTQFSSLSQTVSSLQGTVQDKADKSQITQLSNQIATTVSSLATSGVNLFSDSRGATNWGASGATNVTQSQVDEATSPYGKAKKVVMAASSSGGVYKSPAVTLVTGKEYSWSVFVKANSAGDMSIGSEKGGQKTCAVTTSWQRFTHTFTANDNQYYAFTFYRMSGSISELYIHSPVLTEGNIVPNWSESLEDSATQSQITQLSNRMNFRVTNSDGSVTQIDLANKVISLSGEQVNITGNTYIANGVIKTAAIADLAVSNAKIANLSVSEGKIADLAVTNAKIANLAVSTAKIADLAVTNAKIGSISADKINVGTLNAANVNIINLNASNITTGTISGTNLSINLSTGVVNFKKGRINSASNNIDINIDAGYFSVADSSTRVIIKGGELQFVSPTIFDLDTNPYLSIDNSGGSQGLYGASIVGRDFISLANRANNTNMFDIPIGLEAFAGISFGKPSGSWRPTKIGGAERGIILSGGAALSDSLDSFKGSPRIVIGSDVDGQAGGNRIYILGEYIHTRSVYTKTTSTAANVVVATDGALVRSTSASKYKSDIQRFYDTSIGEKLLDLPYATWLDKAEMQRYSENPTLPIPRKNFGMIAEDLADAGLEELVVRGENNQLEGIQYERLAVALIPVIRELKQEIETLKARVA